MVWASGKSGFRVSGFQTNGPSLLDPDQSGFWTPHCCPDFRQRPESRCPTSKFALNLTGYCIERPNWLESRFWTSKIFQNLKCFCEMDSWILIKASSNHNIDPPLILTWYPPPPKVSGFSLLLKIQVYFFFFEIPFIFCLTK